MVVWDVIRGLDSVVTVGTWGLRKWGYFGFASAFVCYDAVFIPHYAIFYPSYTGIDCDGTPDGVSDGVVAAVYGDVYFWVTQLVGVPVHGLCKSFEFWWES